MIKKFNICKQIDIDYLKDYLLNYEDEFDKEILVVLVNGNLYKQLDLTNGCFNGFLVAILPSLSYGDVKLVISD